MNHNLVIVSILTVGFGLASLLAYIAQRCKLPSILGYLLAGFIIGPYSPGFVANLAISEQLAEIGVILMLFGVGLHFKVEDLANVKNIAIPGAAFQTLISTIVAAILVYQTGWPLITGILIGLAIGVASTVVLVRVLSDRHLLNTKEGHIAIGWLVVEDIFTVIILILLPSFAAFADGQNLSLTTIFGKITLILLQFAFLTFFMFTWGHKIVSYILNNVIRLRSQELFTLTILAMVFIIATTAAIVFGASIALGAFIAGMTIGKTTVRYQAAANSLPLKDIFAVIFFLSVGMLFNPKAIFLNFPLFIGVMSIILIVKPLAAYLITVFLNYPLKTAATVAISLAQIGEFSFILAEEAMELNLLPEDGFDILVACALISISLNPLLFELKELLEPHLKSWRFFQNLNQHARQMIRTRKEILPRVIIVGAGFLGNTLAETLRDFGFLPIMIENNIDNTSHLRKNPLVIFGDASETNILKDAHVENASLLVITIRDITKTLAIIHIARQMNANIQIITHVAHAKDKPLLDALKVVYVCSENETLSAFMTHMRHLLQPSRMH